MRRRPPLWAYPQRWRHTYSREIEYVFEERGATLGDWANLVVAGLAVRLEEEMQTLTLCALAVVAGVSLVMIGYAGAEVEGGMLALHRHWWSAIPLTTFAASVVAMLVFARRFPLVRSRT